MSKSQDLTIFAQETSTTSVQDPRSGRSSGVFHRTRSPSPRISLAFYSFILVWKNQAGVQQVRGSCVPGGPRASTVHWSFDVGYSVLQTVTCHRWSTSRFPVCLFNLGPQSCFHLPKDQLHMMLSNDMAPRNYTGISITPLPPPKAQTQTQTSSLRWSCKGSLTTPPCFSTICVISLKYMYKSVRRSVCDSISEIVVKPRMSENMMVTVRLRTWIRVAFLSPWRILLTTVSGTKREKVSTLWARFTKPSWSSETWEKPASFRRYEEIRLRKLSY